jgi:hypothetical protein
MILYPSRRRSADNRPGDILTCGVILVPDGEAEAPVVVSERSIGEAAGYLRAI